MVDLFIQQILTQQWLCTSRHLLNVRDTVVNITDMVPVYVKFEVQWRKNTLNKHTNYHSHSCHDRKTQDATSMYHSMFFILQNVT